MTIINEGLAELIKRGGLYQGLRGTNPKEVLEAFIGALSPIPSVKPDELLTALLEREALMSTGVGGGIALPHPRNPLVMKDSEQFVALAFLETAGGLEFSGR